MTLSQVTWPPTRGRKGHFESHGMYVFIKSGKVPACYTLCMESSNHRVLASFSCRRGTPGRLHGKNKDAPKNTGVDDMSEENHALKNHSFARISWGFSHGSFWLHSLLADAFRMPRAYGGEYCSSVATHTWMIIISIEEDRTIPTLRPPENEHLP